MRYYLAIMHKAYVEVAYPDTILKTQITRDQTFMIYGALNSALVFTDPIFAVRHAMHDYMKNGQPITSFVKEENRFSSKNTRKDLFVFSREQPVSLIFEVEAPDNVVREGTEEKVTLPESIEFPKMEVSAHRVVKHKLDLVCVVVASKEVHYTEKYAKTRKPQPDSQAFRPTG